MIKRTNHITFAVSDLKETTRFYENVLGFKERIESLKTAFADEKYEHNN